MNTQALPSLELRHGIPEAWRQDAAQLYADVFAGKYQALIGSGAPALRLIAAGLSLSQAFAAIHQGRLVGLVGYHGRHHFLSLPAALLIREFGLIVGLWRYFLYRCQRKRLPREDLQIDGIVVAEDWRSRGLGSLLLGQLARFARRQGRRGLRLGVVDTNPRARQLYERLGFQLLETRHYRLLQGWIPFRAVQHMRLPLPVAPRRRVLAILGLRARGRIVWNPSRSV